MVWSDNQSVHLLYMFTFIILELHMQTLYRVFRWLELSVRQLVVAILWLNKTVTNSILYVHYL